MRLRHVNSLTLSISLFPTLSYSIPLILLFNIAKVITSTQANVSGKRGMGCILQSSKYELKQYYHKINIVRVHVLIDLI